MSPTGDRDSNKSLNELSILSIHFSSVPIYIHLSGSIWFFTHVKSNKDSILYQANTLLVHLQNHSCSCPKGDRSPRNRPVCVGKSERKSWNFWIFTEITSFAIHKCHLETSNQCWNNYIIRMQPTIVINCWILFSFWTYT